LSAMSLAIQFVRNMTSKNQIRKRLESFQVPTPRYRRIQIIRDMHELIEKRISDGVRHEEIIEILKPLVYFSITQFRSDLYFVRREKGMASRRVHLNQDPRRPKSMKSITSLLEQPIPESNPNHGQANDKSKGNKSD